MGEGAARAGGLPEGKGERDSFLQLTHKKWETCVLFPPLAAPRKASFREISRAYRYRWRLWRSYGDRCSYSRVYVFSLVSVRLRVRTQGVHNRFLAAATSRLDVSKLSNLRGPEKNRVEIHTSRLCHFTHFAIIARCRWVLSLPHNLVFTRPSRPLHFCWGASLRVPARNWQIDPPAVDGLQTRRDAS